LPIIKKNTPSIVESNNPARSRPDHFLPVPTSSSLSTNDAKKIHTNIYKNIFTTDATNKATNNDRQDTMRLSNIERDQLNPVQNAVLKSIENGPRGNGRQGIGMIGPFGVFVRSPAVGGSAQALGSAIRFNSSLAENIKEVAICTVGAHFHSKFEFAAHRRLAVQAGVDENLLDQLRDTGQATFKDKEATAHQVAFELLNEHQITDATYAQGVSHFRENGMIELVATVGYYCLISLTLNAFQIPLEADMTDPFPED
jgi:4-carboxymuconolactone decarboxylase